jgi:hypothetical protein
MATLPQEPATDTPLLERPRYDLVLGPSERDAGRPFTDAKETWSDLLVMSAMLAAEREIAGHWSPDIEGPGVSETMSEGSRQLLAVPDGRALLVAHDVTAVGFFGTLRDGVDHAVLFDHERRIAQTFPAYAPTGFLSYFDVGPEHGRYGNLILFWTPEVPASWHANPVHRHAVAAAAGHYEHIRLHRGRIPGPLLDGGALQLEQTQYLEFRAGKTWRALRRYSE